MSLSRLQIRKRTKDIMKLLEARVGSMRDNESLDEIRKLIPLASFHESVTFWDPNVDFYDTGTLLSAAVTCNDLDVVKLFISSGADVNLSLSFYDSPLKIAVVLAHSFIENDDFEKFNIVFTIIKLLLQGNDNLDLKRLELREEDKIGLIARALKEIQIEKEIIKMYLAYYFISFSPAPVFSQKFSSPLVVSAHRASVIDDLCKVETDKEWNMLSESDYLTPKSDKDKQEVSEEIDLPTSSSCGSTREFMQALEKARSEAMSVSDESCKKQLEADKFELESKHSHASKNEPITDDTNTVGMEFLQDMNKKMKLFEANSTLFYWSDSRDELFITPISAPTPLGIDFMRSPRR